MDPDQETPAIVVFVADADQISALVVPGNYARQGMENVIIPWAAGCRTIDLLPFREAKSLSTLTEREPHTY